ncbi:MAG: Gfo/Idh/MocA family oxidoreductase [Candidatus Omnitrophica bacterium]|nr:Gfo/Idh/MocA family oxidoreductase [Candidatus Omnitrophota bacterium]MCG2708261.1 Gfo/Idh/MocA family oxidoreductase [Candidatus Omnitrophota bacterium]
MNKSKDKKVRFALVGCGRIAQRHAELLGTKKVRGAELAAVCDVLGARSQAIGQKYKVPYYVDMDEMMKSEAIDVVSVLTPSGLHAEHVIALAKYKKHIVVEKPMALILKDADAMISVCKAKSIRLFVVKQNRFNYPVLKLREALEEDRFGKIVMGTVRVRWCREQSYYDQDKWRGTWEMDGGVFSNQASHHIDMLEWMLGEPESVFAKATTALVDIEVEDTGVAIIKFKNGAIGVVEATTATRPKDLEGSVSILGANGTVEIGGFAVNEMKVWNFLKPKKEDGIVLKKYKQNPPNVYGFGHLAYLEHVVDVIVNNKKALVDGIEGRKSLKLITAIYQSIETGKEVFLSSMAGKCKLGMKDDK